MGDKDRIQCHFISNTHWDREWRFSAQRTRHMLVYMLDMLFDIFEREPDFEFFHLDSQTQPIQDYLEARPDRADLVRRHVSEGKLLIGPWFCLPDEFCVDGESLIRNLLLGHRIGREFGGVSKTGYSPFSWGQISQMPQIYQGFGIDVASFYRGISAAVAEKSEFYWEGPDGTRVIGSRLATRPRYNVWYVLQRPVYWNQADENYRNISWKAGNGPFRFADTALGQLDYQYVHPEFAYHDEHVAPRAEQALREQDGEWTQPHRFWSAGHDSSCPDIREARLIADCARALKDRADVFHSTVAAWQNGLRDHQDPNWPVLKGEMRYTSTPGSSSVLYAWIISSRMYLKQDNFHTEQALMRYAEPAAVFAAMLGAPYPEDFLRLGYNWLLQNHGHDSMAGCARDIVHEDMLFRSRQAREIAACVFERAFMDIAGAIDLSDRGPEEMALVAWNPAPFARSEVTRLHIDAPQEWECASIAIEDDEGKPVPCCIESRRPYLSGIVQSPNDVANTMPAVRYDVLAQLPETPGFGYRTCFVRPAEAVQGGAPQGLQTGPQSMENEFLRVAVNANGTYDVTDKRTGKTYPGLGFFRDSGETGHPWQHLPPENDVVFTTLNARATVTRLRNTALETAFRAVIDWALPQGRTEGDRGRAEGLTPCCIVNTLTLRKGEPWLEVLTEFDNTAEDHYLQVAFPTGLAKATKSAAQGQFDVVERPIAWPDCADFIEPYQPEHPMNSFVDLSDGAQGLALLNEGLKAYEVFDDAARTLCLTLLRCYPLRICVTSELIDYSETDKGSQCPGRHAFRYAVMPHAGDWAKAGLWQAAARFNQGLRVAQLGPTPHGHLPLRHSFLELAPDTLDVSAVKRGENGEGWIVRLFNPGDKPVKAGVRLNGGCAPPQGPPPGPVERLEQAFALPREQGPHWSKARRVTLEERPERDLPPEKDGWRRFTIGRKQIVTLEFLP